MATKTTDANEMAIAFVSLQIEKAEQLVAAKREIQAQIGDMREMLNTLANNGTASDEQAAWIAENLPKRKRNGADVEVADDDNDDEA